MHLRFIEFATPAFDEALSLRNDILRIPLNLEFNSEDIQEEWNSHHLAYYDDDAQLAGCLTLVPYAKGQLKMRQVAVREDRQRQGIGQALVVASEEFCKDTHYKKIVLHARKTAVPFYEKLGYKKEGKKFKEVGIEHYKMSKTIRKK